MKAERKKKVQQEVTDTSAADAKLQDEVSAFASQLGLTSGSQNGFNDADFRPEVAGQQIGKKGSRPFHLVQVGGQGLTVAARCMTILGLTFTLDAHKNVHDSSCFKPYLKGLHVPFNHTQASRRRQKKATAQGRMINGSPNSMTSSE